MLQLDAWISILAFLIQPYVEKYLQLQPPAVAVIGALLQTPNKPLTQAEETSNLLKQVTAEVNIDRKVSGEAGSNGRLREIDLGWTVGCEAIASCNLGSQ